MASLDSLYAEKNQYQALRSDVSELASKLSASVDAITSAANIQNNYSINDSSPESGIIKIRQEQLQQKKTRLRPVSFRQSMVKLVESIQK